jgi:hypothetical protein
MLQELVLIATTQGHVSLRTDWVRLIIDGSDGITRIRYGETHEDSTSVEVAWSAERVHRALCEARHES